MRSNVKSFSLFFLLSVLVFPSSVLQAQEIFGYVMAPDAKRWADSVYNSLTLEERIGQLIFIRANQSGKDYIEDVGDLIKDYNLGGVVFFAGDPVRQVLKANEWNRLPKTPLLFSIDAEWGLGMRLKNTVKYPLQMTLGAISDDSLIYRMGRQIGEQCRRVGIRMNLAPVVDVNNNPLNPVIGMRSFGQNPKDVARKGTLYMKGLQDVGVIACAKHFPGHGDTQTDSHLTLPVLKKSKKELRSVELVPFNQLIKNGVASVMVAHLSVPAFDKRKNRPATLSEKIVTRLLKDKMRFNGLVVTDGLDMKGVTKYFKKEVIALEAFKAGNDILLIPEDIPASVNAIEDAIKSGKIKEEQLEKSCKKILGYKYLAGAYLRKPVDTANLLTDLNKYEYNALVKEIFKESVTIVKNDDDLLPLSHPDTLKTAILIMGDTEECEFEKPFRQVMKTNVFRMKHDAGVDDRQEVLGKLENFNLVVIALVNTNISAPKQFGISDSDIQFIEHIARKKNVVLDIFASPYALNFFNAFDDLNAIVISYQDKPVVQKISGEIIMGMLGTKGHLPVDAGIFTAGTGIVTQKTRLTYTDPVALHIDTALLRKVDSIAMDGIRKHAYPGCQILAAKDGFIFYDKTFGYHTYDSVLKVKKTDVYDLASLTKILATIPALMKLVDEGKININGKLSDYLFYLKGTNKEPLTFKDVLTHQAGLEPWIPYYQSTLLENDWDTSVYRSAISEEFPVRVAENMYIRENFKYRIYDQIIRSELGKKEYAYSDLGFYLLKDMIEQITNRPFDKYVYASFYEPMGLSRLRFKPRRYFPLKEIIPTENDQVFRHQQLLGDVHDQGAAMLGGVSGHAGLFGDAYDVAVMMQMFLNEGIYGGRKYINKETVKEFTSYQFPEKGNRRGLGFDKPMLEFEEHLSNCKNASPSSFGHSGFTGTYTWADPETGLVYVFLSNRVYPDMDNSTIMDLDIRTNIHQLFYEAIK
ncbi:MAG: serine hydrolase [Chlorobi bacterium]|nr:serine hydrolase [Chlorobiota bacterium]